MNKVPLVSVVMPVFNGNSFLQDAINSILHQTFNDFEFIIIDDGSTNEQTARILSAIRDVRVRIVRNDVNCGVTVSLNRGLELARAKYIARMDADDVARPYRLERQVQFLEAHSTVGLLGSACNVIIDNGMRRTTWYMPPSDLCIRWRSLLTNPFIHSTVVLRRSVLLKDRLLYEESIKAAQDYDLWVRMLALTEGANLDDVLMEYRIHDGSVSATERGSQLKTHDVIASGALNAMLPGWPGDNAITKELKMFLVNRHFPRMEKMGALMDLALHFIDMLAAFVDRYQEHPGLRFVKQDAVWTLVRIFFAHPQLRSGRVVVLRRLLEVDNHCFRSLLVSVWHAVGRRLSKT